jgi:hypothetical protein
MQKALEKLQQNKAQLVVLLYQGSQQEAEKLAKFCATDKNFQNLPKLDLIVHISDQLLKVLKSCLAI